MTMLVFCALLFAASFALVRGCYPQDHWFVTLMIVFGFWCAAMFFALTVTPYGMATIRIFYPRM